jgi:membrane dipeptidase
MLSSATVLRRHLAWDNHACMPLRPDDDSFMPQLQRHRQAGFSAVMLNVGFGDMGPDAHLAMLHSLRRWIEARPADYLLIDCADDVLRAQATGRLAVGFDIEGANAIADRLELVEQYYRLGVRWMLLAYNNNNHAGGGCQDDDNGLTAFGRELVREMERVGMLVCLSHTGHRTARDVLDMASRPVIFSHSNPSALQLHPRNIPDDLIRACAATGGVIGINGVGTFLGQNDSSSATYARHVDYVAKLVGPEHVSVSLDYVFDQQELLDYMRKMQHMFPAEMGYSAEPHFVAPEQLPEIVDCLIGKGYCEQDLQAILGGNLLRLARTAWRSAFPPHVGEAGHG